MFLQQAFSNKVSKDTISDWFFAKSSGMCRQNTGSFDLDSFFMLEWFTDWWKTKSIPLKMVRYNIQRKNLETSIKPWELLKSIRPSGSLEGKYKEIRGRSRALRSTVRWSSHLTSRNEMVNSKICCGVHIGLSTVKCVWFLFLTTERDKRERITSWMTE